MRFRKKRLDLDKIKIRISEINGMIDKTLERGKKIDGFIERWKDILKKTNDPFEKLKATGFIQYYQTELKVLKRRLDLLRKLLRFHEFLRILNEKVEIFRGKGEMVVSRDELEKMLNLIERRSVENELHAEDLEEMVDTFLKEMKG